jgi:hypothetical protein
MENESYKVLNITEPSTKINRRRNNYLPKKAETMGYS